ncbi:MAG: signal recognition particle-docking protein FtsY [Opitutales bacterium]|nr:signal recognition particle-docking protein FtsY [Opitutales bacterium]
MRSFFAKFKEGLKRTTPTFQKIFGKVGGLFGSRTLDAGSIDELEEALYGADFGVETAEEIIGEIRAAFKERKELRGLEAAQIGARVLKNVLDGAEGQIASFAHKPEVIVLVGVNGSGKTTTAAKLAKLYTDAGHSAIVGACDTFRAAANEQIKVGGARRGGPLAPRQHGAESAAGAHAAGAAAARRGADVLLLDTAGRLHNKEGLMRELQKIRRVLQKHEAESPHHAWLVVDGSIGSNSIEQARVFHREFGLTGVIVTKLDGSSRGGALVGIFRELGLPVYFVGLGEKVEDLQPFSVEYYANAVFGLETSEAEAQAQ